MENQSNRGDEYGKKRKEKCYPEMIIMPMMRSCEEREIMQKSNF